VISTVEVMRLWLARIRGDVGAPVGLKTSTSSIGEPLHPIYAVLDRYAPPRDAQQAARRARRDRPALHRRREGPAPISCSMARWWW